MTSQFIVVACALLFGLGIGFGAAALITRRVP